MPGALAVVAIAVGSSRVSGARRAPPAAPAAGGGSGHPRPRCGTNQSGTSSGSDAPASSSGAAPRTCRALIIVRLRPVPAQPEHDLCMEAKDATRSEKRR